MTGSFRERLYESYVSGHQGVLDASRRFPTMKRDVLARLPPDRSVRILDVGCGQGDLIGLIGAHGWNNVTGIDLSAEQVRTAQERGVGNVLQADLFEYEQANRAGYDVVLAMDLVEHFERSQTVDLFSALRGLLAPGGILIMQTPNGASPFSGRLFWSDITHGIQYTTRSLDQVCSAAGFAGVRAYGQRPAVHGFVSGIRAMIWRAIEAFLWIATVAETGQTRGLVLTQNLLAVASAPKALDPELRHDDSEGGCRHT